MQSPEADAETAELVPTELASAALAPLDLALRSVAGFFPTWQLFAFDTVNSTMDQAAAIYAAAQPQRALIYARAQTQGRGRHGKVWLSESNCGVYLSFLLRSNLSPSHLLGLPLAIGVATSKAAARLGVETQLKWPNDLIVAANVARRYRKLAGILIETLAGPPPWLGVGIGIGMNITSTPQIAALDGAALSDYVDPVPDAATVVAEIAREVIETLERFLISGFAPFHAEVQHRSLLTGKDVRLDYATGDSLEGRVLGIAANGALIVDTATGIQNVISGEVTIVDVPRA